LESLIQLSRLNAQQLDAKEKQGELVKARPDAKGLIVNEVAGEAFDLQAAAKWNDQLTKKIKLLEELLKTERAKAGRCQAGVVSHGRIESSVARRSSNVSCVEVNHCPDLVGYYDQRNNECRDARASVAPAFDNWIPACHHSRVVVVVPT
jgi:hypothetical protein